MNIAVHTPELTAVNSNFAENNKESVLLNSYNSIQIRYQVSLFFTEIKLIFGKIISESDPS